MYNKVTLTGMIIASMPVGESDRRITILTRERGKISAFARGARKPTGALLACSQNFAFGEFTLYEGRDSYNLESAEIKTYFADTRNDLNRIYYGMYFCEFALYLSREGVEAGPALNLLYVAMRALERGHMPEKLIRRVFELRYLTENGEMPEVFTCVKCRKKGETGGESTWFDAASGGILCDECRMPGQGVRISASTLFTLRFIVSTPMEKLFSFTVSDEVANELDSVLNAYLKLKVGHVMKTESMLDVM